MIHRKNDAQRESNYRIAFWICFGISTGSALISVFYALSALFGDGAGDTYALYAASRSIALVLAVLTAPLWRSKSVVVVLALVMTLVQGMDALIGWEKNDVMKTIGPAFLAVATLVAALALIRAAHPASSPDQVTPA